MNQEKLKPIQRLYPVFVVGIMVGIWWILSARKFFDPNSFPPPNEVIAGFSEEIHRSMFDNIIASLYRVIVGFGLAALLGTPLGLCMGLFYGVRVALLPIVNFFRSLSPLAWIPFAILWFGIGDSPAIFLIFMAAFFPIALATCAAVANVPQIYFRVARDYGLSGFRLLTQVTLPAIMPQVITSLRVTAGLSWLVVVAAEMIAGKDGLGFAIWDARNGLRPDLLAVGMIVIGILGVILDRLLVLLTKFPSVRWGYER